MVWPFVVKFLESVSMKELFAVWSSSSVTSASRIFFISSRTIWVA